MRSYRVVPFCHSIPATSIWLSTTESRPTPSRQKRVSNCLGVFVFDALPRTVSYWIVAGGVPGSVTDTGSLASPSE